MDNKFLRSLPSDPQLALKVLIFIFCSVGFFAEYKIFWGVKKEFNQVKSQSLLVQRIPSMEQTIRDHTVVTEMGTELKKFQFNLYGTLIREGVPYALIDGTNYAEGDAIGNYTVEKILMEHGGQVILRNKETQEEKTLVVPMPK